MGGRANPPIKMLWANKEEAIPSLLEMILALE